MPSAGDTDELLRQAGAGDREARGALLQRNRARLVQMVRLRLDPRLAARVDPSDVVQDVLAEADGRLEDYLRRRPLPFYPWLRQIACDRLVEQHRRHVLAERRSVRREAPPLNEGSVAELARRLASPAPSPSEAEARREQVEAVRLALARLGEDDREVLALRYLEQLTAEEVAAVLGVGPEAAKKRALRALQKLRGLMERGD